MFPIAGSAERYVLLARSSISIRIGYLVGDIYIFFPERGRETAGELLAGAGIAVNRA
jgi:hypothetical protein